MSTLVIMNDKQQCESKSSDLSAIRDSLENIGVRFSQWPAQSLGAGADQELVLKTYAKEIEALNKEYGFNKVDVVALTPDNPDKAAFRQKFLAEHTHADFELRFFVHGSGLFYLHAGGKVYCLFCEKNDLISVPANTTHWFDMGEKPEFTCIRFFTKDDGWVGEFTGSDIATKYPDYDSFVAEYRK